jgi:hypothetical protein
MEITITIQINSEIEKNKIINVTNFLLFNFITNLKYYNLLGTNGFQKLFKI